MPWENAEKMPVVAGIRGRGTGRPTPWRGALLQDHVRDANPPSLTCRKFAHTPGLCSRHMLGRLARYAGKHR